MQKGAFKKFKHEHYFFELDGITKMIDVFNYESPFGFLGKLADQLFLERYMTQLLEKRNKTIKEFAEPGRWKEILNN